MSSRTFQCKSKQENAGDALKSESKMNYAICNETFQNWSWADTCAKVAELGYDGIEIAPFTLAEDVRILSTHARKVFADTAVRAGLEVVGLHWLLVSPKGLSLTAQDASIRNATSDYLSDLIDFCADLGGSVMVLGSPGQRRIPSGDTKSDAEDRFLQALELVTKRLEKRRVTLCIEPLPAPEADLILTLEEATSLARRIDHANVKSIFDVKSASSENVPLRDLIKTYAPWISHVHANDSNRRGPGFGETDFAPILAALREVEYSGYISIEVFDYSPDPVTIAEQSLKYLKGCEL